ncbi:exocyst complex component exo70 [Xanthoria parietina]
MLKARNADHAEERAEVEVLFAEAAKLDTISRKIKASSARLGDRGQPSKHAVEPVYSNTRGLQTMNGNIDKILDAIDKMLGPSEDKAREERIIRAGPDPKGITDYLASLKRIDRALSQMSSTNLRVNQQAIGDFNELLSEGSSHLQGLYRSILDDELQPVEPLNYLVKKKPFPVLEQEKASKLGLIDSFLSSSTARSALHSSRESPSIRIYAELRGGYLSGSLHNLSTASISTSKRKVSGEIYRQGTSGVGTYAQAIESSFSAEFNNISAVFGRENWGFAFDATCRKALAEFAKTLRELNMHIKANLATDCFLAYEIVEIVTNVGYRLDQQSGQLKLPFADALKPIQETARSSLAELLEDVRRRVSSMQSLPLDGSVIPFTTEVMTRMQTMITYAQSLASVMASLGDGNWQSVAPLHSTSSTSLPSLKSFDVGVDSSQLLARYIMNTIETLLTSLDAKARMLLKTRSVAGVFMANNVALIDRMIRSSDLSSVLAAGNASAKIESWRKKGMSAYLESWREPCSALMDVQYINRSPRPPSGNNGVVDSTAMIKQLGSKDKDSIKEKFKNFNTSFDELSSKHKAMQMEREVRSQLAREVQAMIEPLYARFWDRYHEIDKGKGKYVKYDKGSLSAQLAGLG